MTRLNMPVGVSGFEKLRGQNYFYIDKTELIEQILLDDGIEVRLITRPRRFGKTLSMSMLESFFDIRRDSKCFFHNLKIMENTELCDKWMNRYPVIFLSFKEVDGLGFEEAYAILRDVFAKLCTEHNYLLSSDKVTDYDKDILQRITYRRAEVNEIKDSLKVLTHALRSYWGKPAIVLLDEYDVPIAKASEHGYYEQMLNVIKGMMQVFKDNNDMALAVVTGCLRVAKESVFTGTNNFAVNTISSNSLDEYFGFTQKEVDRILENAGAIGQREKVKEWYDGYRFGNTEIYCPWDVINYARDFMMEGRTEPACYWNNTSGNTIIRSFVEHFSMDIGEEFEILLKGGCVQKEIKEDLTYDLLHSSEENFWSVLYLTGYLTMDSSCTQEQIVRGNIYLRIPNKEVKQIFDTTVREWFLDSVKIFDRRELFQSVWTGDTATLSSEITNLLLVTISFFDYKEDFYHAFLAGIFAGAGYKVESNREHGNGRSDVIVYDKYQRRMVIFEVKHSDEVDALEKDCDKALEQINIQKYDIDFLRVYKQVICYGISFYKKECLVKKKDCKIR